MVIRVFLVDDQDLVRRGVRELLTATDDIDVVGEAATAAQARTRLRTSPADVVILEARLPDGDGAALIRALRKEQSGASFLILTSSDDDQARLDAVTAGASGYVLKQVRSDALVDIVRRVAQGESLLDPTLTARVLEQVRRMSQEDERLRDLTQRERHVLELLGHGQTNREIATTLHLSEKTVKNYVSNLLHKLGMARRTEAALYAASLTPRGQADSNR